MKRERNSDKLSSVRGLTVAVTGECWISKSELARLIHRQRGQVAQSVTRMTDVLVRGTSSRWAHETYGRKEEAAARLIQNGKPLVVVHDYEFRRLIEDKKPARLATTVAGQPIEWLSPSPDATDFLRIARMSGALDREYTSKGRLEQSFLRRHLFKEKKFCDCALCGCKFPIPLLIAAHIKPRSECTSRERRDVPNIVFPLCLFGCDSLYERGFVSVEDQGQVVVTERGNMTKTVREHLRRLRRRKCSCWSDENAEYFRWHYERQFLQ